MSFFLENFFPLDYILLSIAIIFIIFSAWKGFILSILGLLTWAGSIIITLIFYQQLTNFLTIQINKLNFMQNSGFSEIIAFIISIPLIFILSLIILRRFRKILNTDINGATIGVIIDKLFGFLYGIIFSYFIYSLGIFTINKISEDFYYFLTENSYILENIKMINELYLYQFLPGTIDIENDITIN